MLQRTIKLNLLLTLLLVLSACGGGSGGGSQNNLTLSRSTVSFDAVEAGTTPAPEVVTGTVKEINSEIIYIIVEILDPDLVSTVNVDVSDTGGSLTIYPVSPSTLSIGDYTGAIRLNVCLDAGCNNHIDGSPRTITVEYHVEENPELVDSDEDGVPDVNDAFPTNPAETEDTDTDGIGNNTDTDDDNDGVLDVDDAFPTDSTETQDFDTDGIGNNADLDDDNDGYNDSVDYYPYDDLHHEPLTADQISLNFQTILGTSVSIAAQSLGIQGDNLEWSISSSDAWVTLNKNQGTGDDTVSISVDSSGFPSGSVVATLTLSNDFSGETIDISINLDIQLPTLTLSTNTITFDGRYDWDETNQNLNLSLNTGTNSYSWTASSTFTPADSLTLTDSGSAGESQENISIDIDPSGLSEGQYLGTITYTVDVLGEEVSTDLDMEVLASQHVIYVPDSGVGFTSFPTKSALSKSVAVFDSYGLDNTSWSAVSDAAWLSVTSSGTTADTIDLVADPNGLSTDTFYLAEVTISSSDAAIENSATIKVGFWVGDTDPADESSLSIGFTQIMADPVRPYVYGHGGSSDILVYNIYTEELVRTISGVGTSLQDMEIAHDGSKLYVSIQETGNSRVAVIDLENSDSTSEWLLGQDSGIDLEFMQNKGTPLINAGFGQIFHANSGIEIGGGDFPSGYYGTLEVDASLNGNIFCGINSGISPNSISCWFTSYSSYDDTLQLTDASAFSAGSNGRDISLNTDGSKAYVASGAPYVFTVIGPTTGINYGTLPADAYPNAVQVGPDDTFHGAISSWYGPTDVWIYDSSGAEIKSTYASGYADNVLNKQITVSGDGYMTIVQTSDPLLVFISTY